ncbi:MAG: hypothetical protein VKJ06_05135 [Vampirovibrionales bacterium]|nr:hypothetical protein [Vampirovibrionales bacterium]
MVTTPNYFSPAGMQPQPYAPASTPNAAVNIQVFANNGQPQGASTPVSQPAPGMAAPTVPNLPVANTTQQALQNAYQQAAIAQLEAEQARNNYSSLAQQMDALAAYNQAGLQAQPQPAPAFNPYAAVNPYMQQQPMAADPYAVQANYPAQGYGMPAQQQFMPQQPAGFFPQGPVAQPPAQAYDPAAMAAMSYPGAQQAQMQGMQGFDPSAYMQQPAVSGEQIAQLLANPADPASVQQGLSALAAQGRADSPEIFSAINGIISNPADPNRNAALQTLGQLNATQNATIISAKQLPGFDVASRILNSKTEPAETKMAALNVIASKPEDPAVAKVLRNALKRAKNDPQLTGQIQAALSGNAGAAQPPMMYMA